MRRFGATILGLLLLAGCATVPMAEPTADAEGKRFDAPASGRVALYIYRESVMGSAVILDVMLDQHQLGSLAYNTWMRIEVAAGRHELRCKGPEAVGSVVMDLGPGETRYVEVAARMGFAGARCAIFEVQPEKGRSGIMTGRRAAAILS